MTYVSKKGERGLRWTIVKGLERELSSLLLQDPLAYLQTHDPITLIKDSPVRRCLIISGQGEDLFIKHYSIRNAKERLKYLFLPSKARTEWRMLQFAVAHGIPVPVPVAIGERRRRGILKESFLITHAIAPAIPLIDMGYETRRDDYFLSAARLIRSMHTAGLFHRDLHAGNILVSGDEGEQYLIDLHSAKAVKRVSERRRLWNLAQVFYSCEAWLTSGAREEFLRLYDKGRDVFRGRERSIVEKIQRLEGKIYRRHMKSRTKRCLKNSGGFYVTKRDGWRIWSRREWSLEGLSKIVKKHQGIVAAQKEGLIKDDHRTAITIFEFMGKRICVKEYRVQDRFLRLKGLFRRSKAWRGWLMGNGLVVRDIGSITPLALMERTRWGAPREAFLVMESPSGYSELDRYLVRSFERHDGGGAQRSAFMRALAGFLATLYQKRIVHRDLKTCNVMVREEGGTWQFGLVDLDDIRLNSGVTQRALVRELIQLNTSTPLFIEMKDRVRFLVQYLKAIKKDAVRHILLEVIKGSRGRELVYVSPEGDVIMEVDWDRVCAPHSPATTRLR